jgi:hypothetical protein
MAWRRWVAGEYFIVAAGATAEQIGPDALAAVDGRSRIGGVHISTSIVSPAISRRITDDHACHRRAARAS